MRRALITLVALWTLVGCHSGVGGGITTTTEPMPTTTTSSTPAP